MENEISNIEKNNSLQLKEESPISTSSRKTSLDVSRLVFGYTVTWARGYLDKIPIKMTLSNLGLVTIILAVMMPRSITYTIVYPIFRLVFGTLYPAYASYKAIRTKNVKEYVKWMMYWIVFALFTCLETFTDVFLSFWFPFYYEIKILLVLWLLSPATKGSSILYRRFVHPTLIRREPEIDEALARATEQGYTAVLHLGTKGVNYATTVLMQTAIKNLSNVVPQNINVSQSDSAVSRLATRRAMTPDRKRDFTDGFIPMETPSPPSLKHTINTTDELSLNDLDEHLQEERDYKTTSDEDTGHDINADEMFDKDLSVSPNIIFKSTSDQEFKQPKRKTRKSRKDKNALKDMPVRRKIATRSHTGALKHLEADFSDEFDIDMNNEVEN